MDALGFFLFQHARLHSAEVAEVEGGSFADAVFGKLPDDMLRLRPGEGFNSLAWLLWHTARVEDVVVNLLVTDGRQVLDEGWLPELKIPRRDIGTGMTDPEVSELSAGVDLKALRAYRVAVGRKTRLVVADLAGAAWDQAVVPADTARAAASGAFGPNAGWVVKFWQGQSRGGRLGSSALTHNALHLGEAVTVRRQAGLGLAF